MKGDAMMVDTENPVLDFTANDRCDRCGAQALSLAKRDGLEVLFCGHHIKEHVNKLFSEGWTIVHDGAGWESLGYDVPEPQLV